MFNRELNTPLLFYVSNFIPFSFSFYTMKNQSSNFSSIFSRFNSFRLVFLFVRKVFVVVKAREAKFEIKSFNRLIQVYVKRLGL